MGNHSLGCKIRDDPEIQSNLAQEKTAVMQERERASKLQDELTERNKHTREQLHQISCLEDKQKTTRRQ